VAAGAAVGVGAPPAAVAAGASGVWVATENDSLARLDPRTKEVRQTVRVGGGATSVAVTPAAVWVANGLDGTLSRVDPVTLVALFQQSRFSRIADYQLADMGFQEIV